MTKGELLRIIKEVTLQILQSITKPPKDSLLVILPKTAMGIGGCIDYISRHYDTSSATIACHDTSEYDDVFAHSVDLSDKFYAKSACKNANLYGEIVLVNSGIKLIEQIIAMDEDDTVSALVLYKILHGSRVTMLIDYDIDNLPAGSFGKKLKDLHDKLTDMGITVKRITTPDQEKFNPMSGLITEETVEQMHIDGKREIVVYDGVIVTPLAVDRVEELEMRIRQG